MKHVGCPVMILNTLDHLGRFQRKVDEGFLIGYSVCSKAFRVFNSRTRIIQETLHVILLENKPNVVGTGPTWLFDIDSLSGTMNYHLVTAGNQTNSGNNAEDAAFDGKEHDFNVKKPESKVIMSLSSSAQSKDQDDKTMKEAKGKSHVKSVTGYRDLNVEFQDCSENSRLEDIIYSDDQDVVGAEVDFNNLEPSILEEPKRVHQALNDASWIEAMNKKDKRGIMIRNKARLVAQGHTQEEGIDYVEVFAPVARIEAIRLFLAYASFMGFMMYQMEVKSAFLYGIIEDEVYVCQPDKVYKVVKALYGLHQAPRACQDKYVAEILRKFGLTEGKSASTPIDIEKPLLKDPDGEDVDVHIYRVTAARHTLLLFCLAIWYCSVNAVRDVLRLDDAEGVDCLPNKEIFTGLARMGYEKLSTKLTFYKAFFSSQWKFLIHTIMQSLSAKCTSWNEFSFAMASAVICLSTEALDACAALTRRIEHLEHDKVAQNLKITKLKTSVKKLERENKGRMIDKLDRDEGVALIGEKEEEKQAKKINMNHPSKVLSIHEEEPEVQEVVEVVTTAKLNNRDEENEWLSEIHKRNHLLKLLMKPSPRTKSDATEGFDQIIDFLNGSYIKYALTINPHIYVSCIKQFWNTVVVKQSNDVTRLQALVDKKRVVITEATIKDALCLDDAEGVDCLPNDEIFAKLARMGYEKPSTKLTLYKAFFLSQWKFLIHTILQSLSAKRTSWNEFSSAMASAVICLSTEEQAQDDIDDAAAQGADTAVEGDDDALDACAALTRRVEHLEYDKVAQALEITKLKRRVKQLDRGNKVKVKGMQVEIYKIDMDHTSKVLSMQEDEPEVQEVVDVVTTTKLITEVVTAASTTTAAAEP
nr:hypothetical protein [Tanacetum cinerariifolium]